jgi:serine/threonine-protein kinase
LYELLTGHSPYQLKNRSALEILRTITETQPRLPSTIVSITDSDSASGDPFPNPESVSKTREGSPERLRRRLRGDLDNIVLMAIRKEPQRRYQSVDQLSEDIGRHLQGLPIAAHKDTFTYRAGRFVFRNRIPVAIAAFALLVLAISAATLQWKANRQAKLFQEFGQEVARIEASMRYAYLLPLHDIQEDQKQVVDRLDYIKKRMQTMGSVSHGPGFYSLGRGYLSLHRYQDAYDNLILAWQKHQYREPAAANALGLSLAMLYQEKLQEAEQLYSKEQLEQRKLQLEKLYRTPALQYIQMGKSASEVPEYVDALLAFLEKRYAEALNKTTAAAQKISWFYEGKKLEGDILAAMGNLRSEVGDASGAHDLYEKARTSYLEAAQKAQSDPQIYEGLCALQYALQKMHLDQKGTTAPTLVKEGISYCEKALIADSRNINANLYAATIHSELAYAQYLHGADCSEATEKAAAFARAVLIIDPENGMAFKALGNAYKVFAAAEIERGGNPVPSLKIASSNLEKAIEKMPGDAELLSNLGANYINQALYESETGQDSIASINKAIQVLERAVQLNPNHSQFRGNLGIAYCRKGMIQANMGLDSRESFRQSIEESKKTIQVNPKYLSAYIWAGLASNQLALNLMEKGENPLAAIDDAIVLRTKALELDPDNAYSYNGLGMSFFLKAKQQRLAIKDAETEIQSALESYKKSISLN